jgi:hypothetical protein
LRKISFNESPLRVVVARRINTTWFLESDLCEGFGELVFSTENVDEGDIGDLILVKLKVSGIHQGLVLNIGGQIFMHYEKRGALDSDGRKTYLIGGGTIPVQHGTKEPDIIFFMPGQYMGLLHGIIEVEVHHRNVVESIELCKEYFKDPLLLNLLFVVVIKLFDRDVNGKFAFLALHMEKRQGVPVFVDVVSFGTRHPTDTEHPTEIGELEGLSDEARSKPRMPHPLSTVTADPLLPRWKEDYEPYIQLKAAVIHCLGRTNCP